MYKNFLIAKEQHTHTLEMEEEKEGTMCRRKGVSV